MLVYPYFIAALFTIVTRWKQPVSIDGWMDKPNVVNTYNKILFSLKKEGNTDLYYNMDETWAYYAKWNKPITKRPIQYDSNYMRYWE